MATAVRMKHRETGIAKNGYYGFSWTSFFWGGFPALLRGDVLYGLLVIVLGVIMGALSMGILGVAAWLVWAVVYNKNYTHRLLREGFEFDDSPERVAAAKAALGVA